ncbi:MAG TPA: heme-binding domain-containing protein [Chitinophaga sp.]|nr:heme-binding domain-containing protein [Chitinophaga sp.]
MKRHKKAKITIAVLLLLVIAIQFVQRPVSNTAAANPIKAPAEVTDILRRACYDCHSNETRLSWYDRMAPASWLVARHVNEGRSRFNFSTWDTLSKADQNALLWEMLNMVVSRKMPLADYSALHPGSKLTQRDVETLKKYVTDLSPATYHDTVEIKRAQDQADRSRQTAGQPVAANGVRYIPDYQNWQVISTTNRFDNHSIRILYANDICAKAIRENRINPLPEGSTIVKVVWNSIEEENGDIKPGSLNNIQIMTKDNKRFPDSKGWGFAKFNGTELKPYGKTATFNQTCFNCHKIAQATDYAFSLPLQNKDLK